MRGSAYQVAGMVEACGKRSAVIVTGKDLVDRGLHGLDFSPVEFNHNSRLHLRF